MVDYAKRRGVSDKVEFAGWITYNELHKYMKNLDICVLPFDNSDISHYSMPMKIHEYSLCKKPIISAPLPEIVKTYSDFVLYASTPREYASCVKLLVENQEKRRNIVQNAYLIAQKNLWTNLAEKYEEVLSSF